ncbi:hypothetical protein [Hymenobacter algoricola]|uniref:Response regulator n=1 Tax=Hymenobacter algoricola TaxID=486267 RepID=A0ABP7NXG0_9BACT
MNIVVFENEYSNICASFQAVNLIYFKNKFKITDYASSQTCPDLNNITKDSCIFVDIDLSSKSNMDGFELIEELLRIGFPRKNIVILTGHVHIADKAMERGLGDLPIVTKPIDFNSLRASLEPFKSQ